MKNLIENIEQWAEDRNLIKGSTPLMQSMKLLSEFGELTDAIGKRNIGDVKDGIGDVFVVMTIMCKQTGNSIIIDNGYTLPLTTIVENKALDLGKNILEFSNLSTAKEIKSLLHHIVVSESVDNMRAIANAFELTLEQCVAHAYNEIKDRKGYMSNGIFIKEC